MQEMYLYGSLMVVGYLVVGLSCLRVYLHQPDPRSPLASLSLRRTMTHQTHPIRIDVVHLDVHFRRYTPDGALRYAMLSQYPGREVIIDASYAERTVSTAILTKNTPKAWRVCLN